MSDRFELIFVAAETLKEWRRIGSWRYISALPWIRRNALKALLTLSMAIAIPVVGGHYGWLVLRPPQDPTKPVIALAFSIMIIALAVLLFVRETMKRDRKRILESCGINDVDPRDVGVLGEDTKGKNTLLYS